MLPSQQLEVRKKCQAAGLTADELQWQEHGPSAQSGEMVWRVTHMPTGYYATFHQVSDWAGSVAREIQIDRFQRSMLMSPPQRVTDFPFARMESCIWR